MPKAMVPFLRSAYNYDRELASDEAGLDCSRALDPETGELVSTPSLTKQSFRDETDINVIVRRFSVTGELPQVRAPSFQIFDGVFDYHSAMDALVEARESFMELPGEVRARFHNDPGEFLEFCHDTRNREEAVRLGIVVPPPAPVEPSVMKVEVVNPPDASGDVQKPPKRS